MCDYSAASYKGDHARRFALSLEWLEAHRPKLDRPLRVLETGGHGVFTPMYRERWPEDIVHETDGDLRAGVAVSGSCYDLILSMEVLEHINDVEDGTIPTEWRGSGVRNYLRSMRAALAPGGRLFLTTPNACSITTIHHALHGKPPYLYRPHVREYAPYELDQLLREEGFLVERRETLDVWRNAISPEGYAILHRFIRDTGYLRDLRGEDIFAVAG